MTIKCPQNDCGKELNIIFDTNKILKPINSFMSPRIEARKNNL